MHSKINVLMVDQAVTFGGSLVVMANIANHFPEEVQTTIVYEVSETIVTELFNENIVKYRVCNVLDYRLSGVISSYIKSFKFSIIKKVLSKLFVVAKSISSYVQVLRIAIIILVKRIDIVHTNNSDEAIVAAKILNRKVVLHLHGISDYEPHELRNTVDGYIAISSFVAKQAAKKGYDIRKTILLDNPTVQKKLDLSKVKFYKEKFGIFSGEKVFGIVGRIIWWKGQLEFLEAANLVLKKTKNTKALIIGDSSDGADTYVERVKKKVQDMGLEDRVVFTGYIGDVHNLMTSLNMLVHSSIESEPFGLVITEAMSMGIPVVASDKGAASEIIKSGKDGKVMDPYKTEEVADFIIEVLENDELANTLGCNAKNSVLKRYAIEPYIRDLVKFYKKVLLS